MRLVLIEELIWETYHFLVCGIPRRLMSCIGTLSYLHKQGKIHPQDAYCVFVY